MSHKIVRDVSCKPNENWQIFRSTSRTAVNHSLLVLRIWNDSGKVKNLLFVAFLLYVNQRFKMVFLSCDRKTWTHVFSRLSRLKPKKVAILMLMPTEDY